MAFGMMPVCMPAWPEAAQPHGGLVAESRAKPRSAASAVSNEVLSDVSTRALGDIQTLTARSALPPATGGEPSLAAPNRGSSAVPSGKALEAPLYLLDELAWSLGVTPLSTFTDDRLLPDEWAHDPEHALASLGPRDDWHALGDGLRSCAALLRELRVNPQAELDETVAQALQALHDWLTQAQAAGRNTFRLDAAG